MSDNARHTAVQNYRSRPADTGIERFELQAPAADRDLLHGLARRLVQGGPEAESARRAITQMLTHEPPQVGGIWAALRRSPLVGADLDLRRTRVEVRPADL